MIASLLGAMLVAKRKRAAERPRKRYAYIGERRRKRLQGAAAAARGRGSVVVSAAPATVIHVDTDEESDDELSLDRAESLAAASHADKSGSGAAVAAAEASLPRPAAGDARSIASMLSPLLTPADILERFRRQPHAVTAEGGAGPSAAAMLDFSILIGEDDPTAAACEAVASSDDGASSPAAGVHHMHAPVLVVAPAHDAAHEPSARADRRRQRDDVGAPVRIVEVLCASRAAGGHEMVTPRPPAEPVRAKVFCFHCGRIAGAAAVSVYSRWYYCASCDRSLCRQCVAEMLLDPRRHGE